MRLAPPSPGSVIRYSYLWADRHARGAAEGDKDRPSMVLALAVRDEDGEVRVLALAITHSAPKSKADAVAIPPLVGRSIGLDSDASWIVTTEANAFIWPGPDLRPIPGRKPKTVVYGRLPPGLLAQAARSYLANRRRKRARTIPRTA